MPVIMNEGHSWIASEAAANAIHLISTMLTSAANAAAWRLHVRLACIASFAVMSIGNSISATAMDYAALTVSRD
jgi:hypothetical protein